MSTTSQSYRDRFEGLDVQVPLLDGSQSVYINLDNAASTPAMLAVRQTVDDFLFYYSSVHRGKGLRASSPPRLTNRPAKRCWALWEPVRMNMCVSLERIQRKQ